MEHNTPCTALVDSLQCQARTDERVMGHKEMINGLDAECCKNRDDISKLRVQIAILATTASFLGGALGGWIGDVTRGLVLHAVTGAKIIVAQIVDAVISAFC